MSIEEVGGQKIQKLFNLVCEGPPNGDGILEEFKNHLVSLVRTLQGFQQLIFT